MSSLREWLEETGVRDQEAELLEKALKQGIVAGHDRPSQQIRNIESNYENIVLSFGILCATQEVFI